MASGGGFNLLHAAHDRGVFVNSRPFILCFIAANVAFLTIAPEQTLHNFEMVMLLSPVWLPILLGRFGFLQFIVSKRLAYMANLQFVLLEIRLPRDVAKTPLAMEAVLTSMHIWPGESNWWKRLMRGQVRPWWSLEIASLGGRVHFFIWTRDGYRRGVENYFYAQYPGVEIVEATDYSRLIDPSHAPYQVWGTEYEFKNADVFPIRTYQEFMKPDSAPLKPEEQIDPLAQIIEFIGGIGPQEQFWVQILIRATRGEKFLGRKNAKGEKYTLKDLTSEHLEALRKQTVHKTTRTDPTTGQTFETESFPNPSRGVQNTMEAVERKVAKPLFDVGIRALYTAPRDAYQGTMVSHLIGLLRSFSSETLNGFGIKRWFANFDDWPWEDKKGTHHAHAAHGIVDAYRRRSYFNEPYRMPWMIMNAEELATLFHVPSSGVTTPSLPRIQSATSEAPSNLPT